VGEEVELTILRDGAERRLRARVERSAGSSQAAALQTDTGTAIPRLRGAILRDISPGMPMYGRVQGVVVVEVEAGSPTAARGLRAGDVIVAVNRKPVRNVAELRAALQEAGRVAALDVLRGNTSLFILIT
jgi:S1-C subfamily serine protease